MTLENLIRLLVVALVLLVIWWIAGMIAVAIGAPAIAMTITAAILALVFILYALRAFGIVV